MPTIRKHPKTGYYFVDYIVDGRRYRKSSKTRNKTEAEKILHSLADKINRNEFSVPDEIGTSEFLAKYLVYSRNHKSKSSFMTDRTTATEFFKMCRLPLKKIRPFHIEEFISAQKNKSKKNSSINRAIDVLKAMFNKAVEWVNIPQNPAKNIKKLPDTTKKLPRFLIVDEIKRVLSECPPWLYNIVATLILTGLRVGELANLTWDDADVARKKLHIQSKDGWSPKTYQIRTIPMHPIVAEILARLTKKSKYVFASPEGRKLNTDNLQKRYFSRLAKKINLKNATIHTLRHTFASHLAMKGVPIYTISKLLGHSGIKTTMIYSHLAPDHFESAVNQFPDQAIPATQLK